MNVRSLLVCVAVVAFQARGARAQSGATLSIDAETEVRLTLRPPATERMNGRVVRLAGDTIVLHDGDVVTRTAIADLVALEVRGGEDKRRGFLIGAGVATTITAVFGGIDVSKGNISRDDFVGTMIGNALIGGLVGYAFAPKGWERIPLPGTGR